VFFNKFKVIGFNIFKHYVYAKMDRKTKPAQVNVSTPQVARPSAQVSPRTPQVARPSAQVSARTPQVARPSAQVSPRTPQVARPSAQVSARNTTTDPLSARTPQFARPPAPGIAVLATTPAATRPSATNVKSDSKNACPACPVVTCPELTCPPLVCPEVTCPEPVCLSDLPHTEDSTVSGSANEPIVAGSANEPVSVNAVDTAPVVGTPLAAPAGSLKASSAAKKHNKQKLHKSKCPMMGPSRFNIWTILFIILLIGLVIILAVSMSKKRRAVRANQSELVKIE
jgi:hypothetical protein